MKSSFFPLSMKFRRIYGLFIKAMNICHLLNSVNKVPGWIVSNNVGKVGYSVGDTQVVFITGTKMTFGYVINGTLPFSENTKVCSRRITRKVNKLS